MARSATTVRQPARRTPAARGCHAGALAAALLLLLAARDASACGAEGERACCVTEVGLFGDPCAPGLWQMPPCAGPDCTCPGGAPALGVCTRKTSCGGFGQRACCGNERPSWNRCDPGLIPVEGCSGDCFCGENLSVLQSYETCTRVEPITEPSTGYVSLPPPEETLCPMRGYADMHLHLLGHMAHGGGVIAGKPYDDSMDGPNVALRPDFGTFEDMVAADGGPLGPALCPSFIPGAGPLACGPTLWHGAHTLFDNTTAFGTKDGSHANFGAPVFNGWPRWRSTVHQQAYWKWLKRAWHGGLRLITLLAVSNEALCRTSRHLSDADCSDSMASIDAQIEAAYAFQAFVDSQPGNGWFRIVTTPEDARAVIRDGKLAVVLGIEVDNLFGCKENGSCDEAYVRAKVDEYYAKGVRHILPIHNFDNAFGGAATWGDVINIANAATEGRFWQVENCYDEGYGFWLDNGNYGLLYLLGFGAPIPPIPYYPWGGGTADVASCNKYGLTELGKVLINALIDKRMIVDIDHMSRHSRSDTLAIAESRGAPVAASHALFMDMYERHFAGNEGIHERMLHPDQINRIRAAGGMIAAMLKDDVQDGDHEGGKYTLPYAVADDCRYSTKEWANHYLYATFMMKGQPVALGSDFNGVAGHIGPRFGSDACGATSEPTFHATGDAWERSAQVVANNRLQYPFSLPGFGSFDRMRTGQKEFDFNTDGLAHIGLLPDMIADLYAIGFTQEQLDPLFRSAEGYIELWERVLGVDGDPTRDTCQDVFVTADANCNGWATVASESLQQDPAVTLVQVPLAPYPLGTTEVSMTATTRNACSPPISCTGTITVVDQTPPPIHCPPSIALQGQGPTQVFFPGPSVGADNCSEATFLGCDPPSGSMFPAGTTQVTCRASDEYGNISLCMFDVSVGDFDHPRRARGCGLGFELVPLLIAAADLRRRLAAAARAA